MSGYLEQRRLGWYAVVEVPPNLRAAIGKKRLIKSLQTRDKTVANARKWKVVAALKAQIEAARRGEVAEDLMGEALSIRAERQVLGLSREGDLNDGFAHHADHIASELRGDPIGTGPNGEYVYEPEREKRAGAFFGVAMGFLTPIELYVERWLSETHFTPRTVGDHKRAIERLKLWGVGDVEQVDRKRAGAFVSWLIEHRSPQWSGDPKTIAKYTSSLSSYWRWLIKRGHTKENPWIGQAPSKPKGGTADEAELERPFTDEEIKRLLEGPADPALSDLMRIAALTGARIDAIVNLRVRDCANGSFRFKPQKKEVGSRLVPIHSDLKALVARRCEGKQPDEYLIHEAPVVPKGSQRERSMPLSKRFGRYTRAQKVAVLIPGKRRSLVNFHSFRRWFITKAERAGQPVHIIEAVVGHKRAGMTLGRYSGGPDLEQVRTCVEAVRLP